MKPFLEESWPPCQFQRREEGLWGREEKKDSPKVVTKSVAVSILRTESAQQGRPITNLSWTFTARSHLNFRVGKAGEGARSVAAEDVGEILRTFEECDGTA